MWNYINFKSTVINFEIVNDTPLIEIEAFSIKNLINFLSKIIQLITQVLSIILSFNFSYGVSMSLYKVTRYTFPKLKIFPINDLIQFY